jgi:asparagine synthetase B (glutamine-hydrolysing)
MFTDRMTKAHGLEAPTPFVDHQLAVLLVALPTNLKIHGWPLK